jgi:hypothetical protein
VTTAPEAKKRIVALIAARPALADVAVTYGAPTRMAQVPQTGDRAMIYLSSPLPAPPAPGVADGDTEWGALGRVRRREEYTIAMTADVLMAGDDESGTETRAAQLLSEAQNALTSDPTLGRLLREGVTFESGSLEDTPLEQPEGWRAWATCRVRCVADVLAT